MKTQFSKEEMLAFAQFRARNVGWDHLDNYTVHTLPDAPKELFDGMDAVLEYWDKYYNTSKSENGWHIIPELPDDGEMIFNKRKDSDRTGNVAIYREGADWFYWTGEKLTKESIDQIYSWKYKKDL